jgi:hypothetical protein
LLDGLFEQPAKFPGIIKRRSPVPMTCERIAIRSHRFVNIALLCGRSCTLAISLVCFTWTGGSLQIAVAADTVAMTEDEAVRLGEEFGVVVGSVDEDIRKELKLQEAKGVAVFEVIGNSRADYAGIKVRSVIKEIDKTEIRNMMDFGIAIKKAMKECNFTLGTYEPADPGDPVGWGVNFHFVGCKRD